MRLKYVIIGKQRVTRWLAIKFLLGLFLGFVSHRNMKMLNNYEQAENEIKKKN